MANTNYKDREKNNTTDNNNNNNNNSYNNNNNTNNNNNKTEINFKKRQAKKAFKSQKKQINNYISQKTKGTYIYLLILLLLLFNIY